MKLQLQISYPSKLEPPFLAKGLVNLDYEGYRLGVLRLQCHDQRAKPFQSTMRSIPRLNGFSKLPFLSETRAIAIAVATNPLSSMLLPSPVAAIGFASMPPEPELSR
jgi:hypothetical protein